MRPQVKYKRGFRYYLYEDFLFPVPGLPDVGVLETYKMALIRGNLRIYRGYMWDSRWKNRRFIRASLIHYALWQLIRLGYLDYSWRLKANELLYRALTEDGVPKVCAWTVKTFLDLLGKVSSQGGRKVLVAP